MSDALIPLYSLLLLMVQTLHWLEDIGKKEFNLLQTEHIYMLQVTTRE
jgi:hypothetical protein